MTTTTQSRQLSYLEKYYFWRTELKYYANYRVLAEYTTPITQERLYHALKSIINKYSVFATTFEPNKNAELGYEFSIIDSIKLSDIAEFINDEQFEDNPELVLNTSQHERFEHSAHIPTWKVKVINSKYVLFYSDHIFFDGTSSKNFHIELAKELLRGSEFEYNGIDSLVFEKSLVENYKLCPSSTEIINHNGPVHSVAYKLMVALLPKRLSDFVKYWISGSPYYNLLNYDKLEYKDIKIESKSENLCKVIHLTPIQLNSLISLSRSHNVKLTSLISVLAIMTASKYIPETKDTTITIPVNIRNLIDTKKSENYSQLFGLYMSFVDVDLPPMPKLSPNNELNWSLVQYVHEYLHTFAKDSPIDLGLLRFVDVKDYITEKYEQEKMTPLEVSNVGMLGTEHSNIVNAWFDQPSQMFSVNMISTSNGANLVLRCQNTEWVDGFKTDLENLITSLT